MENYQLKWQKIMIFGGTGSLGKELVKRFVDDNVVVVFSRDEAKQWTLKNEIKNKNLHFEIGDMRDYGRVATSMRYWKPNIVIIAGALKQVDTCEIFPLESIKTNILGVNNVADAAAKTLNLGATVCMVSTDKACSPINVYGMCKSIAERVVLEHSRRFKETKYVAVRYGNVLESRGSIVPLFKYQAQNSNSFTVTDPNMTRFIMTLDQSVDLIERTIQVAGSGETWIPKLPSMKIGDLAEIFSERYGKPIEIIGHRPGEKMHEALVNKTESYRVFDVKRWTDTTYYGLKPVFEHFEPNEEQEPFEYTSGDNPFVKTELHEYLQKLGILDTPIEEHVGKSIEEIRT